jgi:hypothetical protein
MNKQTAVHFLIEKIDFDANVRCFSKDEWNEIFEQANQMYKEQIVDGWLNGMKGEMIAPLSIDNYKPEAEEYFNETYGGQDE